MVDNRRHIGYTISCPVREGRYGGIAQLARALGSYPSCPRFKSRCRYHAASAAPHGALVKRLRHRPFTAVTRVRFPYASPTSPIWRHSSAGRALASHARGHRFEFCCLHHEERHDLRRVFLFCFQKRTGPRGRSSSVLPGGMPVQAHLAEGGGILMLCSTVRTLFHMKNLISTHISMFCGASVGAPSSRRPHTPLFRKRSQSRTMVMALCS